MSEKWSVTKTRQGYGYLVLDQNSRVIADVPDQGNAHLIASLPQLKEVRYEYAQIINKLAIDLLAAQGVNSNDRDFAEEALEIARPYLGCLEIGS